MLQIQHNFKNSAYL